jgi:hypothetical protein
MCPELLPRLDGILGDDPFYFKENQELWALLQLYHDLGRPLDRVTLGNALQKNDTVSLVYCAECVNTVPTTVNWDFYAGQVADLAYRRRGILSLEREIRSLYSGEPLEDILHRVRTLADSPPRARLMDTDDLTGWQDPEPPKYVIQDLCCEKTTVVLTSPGGLGKSLFALSLGLSVATGTALFPSFVPVNPGHVLYISGEDPTEKVQMRMAGTHRQYHLDPALVDQYFHVRTRNNRPLVQGDRTHGVKLTQFYYDIQAYCREIQPRVLIIDTLRRCIGGIPGGENDNGVVGFLIESITDLVRDHGGIALVLSHAKKPADTENHDVTRHDARGASALVDEARTHFMLSMDKESNDMLVTLTKANYAPRDMLFTTWRFTVGAHRKCPYLIETGQQNYAANDPEALIPIIIDYIATSDYDNWPVKLAQDGKCKPLRDRLQRKFPWAGANHILDACALAVKQGRLLSGKGTRKAGIAHNDVLTLPPAGYTPPALVPIRAADELPFEGTTQYTEDEYEDPEYEDDVPF